ncbi:autophagy-related protein 16-1-like [Mercenaria mercenaria]|uniref:autophagy-related protein 16-1-like n=1 Tax=Mercenaria mercenaria TaxID=6596 RepID=UPI00234ECACD|nr:autophagy-related protein 16-1-like [Mercenaria mercenaria]
MKEKEKELQLKDSKLMDALALENSLKAEIKHLEHTVFELEATNQTLKDEHQALQMAFTALEEKYRKVQEENSELMARWLNQKMKEADVMNQENDRFFRHKQERLQKDLEDAASEPVQIKAEEIAGVYMRGVTPICLSASLPTKAQCKLDAHEGEVNAVLWSPTGSLFATGGSDRKIKLWDYNGGQCTCKGTLLGSNAGITALEFDLDEEFVLGASNDYASRLWSLSDQRLRHTLTGHSGKVLTAKFLGDSTKVVTGSHDRTLKIWDLHTRACSKTIFAGSSCNDLVTLHASSIISGHFDKRVRFWDPRSDQTINEISLQGRITSLALSPDRATLMACTREDTLKVIDLRMNQVVYTLSADNFKVAFDYSRAVFSPDGSYAMAGSSDGTLYIWNIKKGKVERTLKEHTHAIMACSWHPSGSVILSSEKQKKVVLWSDI